MKTLYSLLLIFLAFSIEKSFGQTVMGVTTNKHLKVQLNESTVVRDESGKKISYPDVQKFITTGEFTLDPIPDYMGVVAYYKIRAKKDDALATSSH